MRPSSLGAAASVLKSLTGRLRSREEKDLPRIPLPGRARTGTQALCHLGTRSHPPCGLVRGLTSFRAKSGLRTGRSEAEKVTVMVEEPRVSGCAELCRWFLLPPFLSFPMCTMQGNFEGHLLMFL